jgi:hypothetical protein
MPRASKAATVAASSFLMAAKNPRNSQHEPEKIPIKHRDKWLF